MEWEPEKSPSLKLSFRRSGRQSTTRFGGVSTVGHGEADDGLYEPLPYCVLHPSSVKRMIWDLAGLFMMLIDLITVPLVMAFSMESAFGMRIIAWIVAVFWSVDIPISCLTSYSTEGALIVSIRQILLHYLRTWMLFDVAVVSMDWYFLVADDLEGGEGSGRLGRVIMFFRFTRSLRLIRVLKLGRIFASIEQRLRSEAVYIYLTIVKHLTTLVLGLHVVACIWYAIGSSGDVGWVNIRNMQEESFEYKYAMSLYWAVAQVQGSANVGPTNLQETIFNICMLLSALVAFTSFLGSLTTLMTRLRALVSEETQQMWQLRQYLRQRKIRSDITMRIVNHVECELRRVRTILKESDVTVLKLLPEQICVEIKVECFKGILYNHVFFNSIRRCDSSIFRVIMPAITVFIKMPGEVVFTAGMNAEAMLLVADGELSYALRYSQDSMRNYSSKDSSGLPSGCNTSDGVDRHSGSSSDVPLSTDLLQKGAAISEACLWARWTRLGDLTTTAHVQLIAVDSQTLRSLALHHMSLRRIGASYAAQFLRYINDLEDWALTDLIDGDKAIPSPRFAIMGGATANVSGAMSQGLRATMFRISEAITSSAVGRTVRVVSHRVSD